MSHRFNLSRVALLVAGSASLAFFGVAVAQEGDGSAAVVPAREVGAYAGVRPGEVNPPPREKAAKALASRGPISVLTWPGFQITPSGSRFFLQTTSAPMTETKASEGRYEIILKNARTHVRNTRRWLDTRFFPTPVRRARVERRGRRDLAFVFELKGASAPSVSSGTGPDGYTYLYVDWPPAPARPN